MPKDALETPTPQKPLSVDERLLAILEAQQQSSAAQSTMAHATAKRLAPKSLDIGEISQISPFNPRGEREFPMPRLKCEMFAPWKMDPNSHGQTREEVELLNMLEPGDYTITMNDDSTLAICIVGTRNHATGKLERLEFKRKNDQGLPEGSPFNNDNKQQFRSLAIILREILGDKAEDVLTMKQEKARIALPTSDPKHLAVSVNG